MKQIQTLLLLLITLSVCAQTPDSIRINGHLKGNTRYAKVVVRKFGIGYFDIAATPVKNEKFSLAVPPDIEPGVYRLMYSLAEPGSYVDVIINGTEKHISFELDVTGNERRPVFTKSEKNKGWYDWQIQAQQHLQKLETINRFLSEYPNRENDIVKQAEEAAEKEKAAYQKAFNTFVDKNKDAWAAAMVANRPYYFSNPYHDWRIQDYYRRLHYWDGINTANPALLNSPLYTEHILGYLQYYMNPEMQFGREEMEQGFISSIDTIMQKFGDNEQTKNFAIKYLQLGFKEIGNEEALQYIDQNYAAENAQCLDESEAGALEQRMAGYEAMKPGMPAPQITWNNADGSLARLSDIKADTIAIVFWASWCPHCTQVLPEINRWAANKPNVKVLAISLDTDYNAYQHTAKELSNMLHYCDLQQWDSPVVKDYYIYDTPTFILLDKEHKITGKYSSWPL